MAVDVSNPRSFDDAAVLDFFTMSTRNLLSAGQETGVDHHIALSVVGTDRLAENGCFRAKIAQEQLIKEGPLPYFIIRAAQFFEFLKDITNAAIHGNEVQLPPVLIQPIAADDIASAADRACVGQSVMGTIEIAGPDQFWLDKLIRNARMRSAIRVK